MPRKHDDAHRPMQGRGQRGNRVGKPANWGGAELVEHQVEPPYTDAELSDLAKRIAAGSAGTDGVDTSQAQSRDLPEFNYWLGKAIDLADRYAKGDQHARLTLHIHLAAAEDGFATDGVQECRPGSHEWEPAPNANPPFAACRKCGATTPTVGVPLDSKVGGGASNKPGGENHA